MLLKRSYISFYWPLLLMGLAMISVGQFQNGVLTRYPEASRKLAIFAFATGTFQLFLASMGFVSQMVNVLGRDRRSRMKCLKFTLVVCLCFTAPPAFLAFAPKGRAFLAAIYSIDSATLESVIRYLRLMLPLIFIQGLRQYYSGLIIQARRTLVATLLIVLQFEVLVGILILGLHRSWPAVETLVFSQMASFVMHMILAWLLSKVLCKQSRIDLLHGELTYGHILAFFWPVAVTSIVFSLSRPILYALVKRAGEGVHGENIVATLRISFTFAMIFHFSMNQFRHLFITFGREHFPTIRRFMIRVLAIVTVVMILVVATPLSTILLRDILGVEGEVLRMADESLWILCLIPLVVTLRNYFHSLSLVNRRTGPMALGAILRNVSIFVSAWLLYRNAALTHMSASAVLVMGFVVETIIVSAPAMLNSIKTRSARAK